MASGASVVVTTNREPSVDAMVEVPPGRPASVVTRAIASAIHGGGDSIVGAAAGSSVANVTRADRPGAGAGTPWDRTAFSVASAVRVTSAGPTISIGADADFSAESRTAVDGPLSTIVRSR